MPRRALSALRRPGPAVLLRATRHDAQGASRQTPLKLEGFFGRAVIMSGANGPKDIVRLGGQEREPEAGGAAHLNVS
jgi:hypothetical protein